jgi:hypothetical protein
VLRDPLVEHVPRRQAELRLEEREDPERTENETRDEPDRTHDPPATQAGRRVHDRTVLVEGRQQDERPDEPDGDGEEAHDPILVRSFVAEIASPFRIR